jgi:hypothetical protein
MIRLGSKTNDIQQSTAINSLIAWVFSPKSYERKTLGPAYPNYHRQFGPGNTQPREITQ